MQKCKINHTSDWFQESTFMKTFSEVCSLSTIQVQSSHVSLHHNTLFKCPSLHIRPANDLCYVCICGWRLSWTSTPPADLRASVHSKRIYCRKKKKLTYQRKVRKFQFLSGKSENLLDSGVKSATFVLEHKFVWKTAIIEILNAEFR